MANARVRLDYADKAIDDLLKNISGVAFDEGFLWTVSDEGRTFECLNAAAEGDGFVLVKQYPIDDPALLPGWPGADKQTELDLESVDVANGALWLCASHCKVRRKPEKKTDEGKLLLAEIRPRPSRHLLARIDVNGDQLGRVKATPPNGPGSIREALANDPYLEPFLGLPSKENGLDVEGMAIFGDEVLLGLRGPRLDSYAVVVHVKLDNDLKVRSYNLSCLDLGGLAVRDLCRDENMILIIAGPVGDAGGPFRIFRWEPEPAPPVQKPGEINIQHPREMTPANWPADDEKPEGICVLARAGKKGYLVVYDSPANTRLSGSTYEADWLTIP
jgi:hypothetical protein